MGYLTAVGRAIVGMTRLGSVLVRYRLTKRTAIRQFQQELLHMQIPRDIADQLTAEYADMVRLNPVGYAKLLVQK